MRYTTALALVGLLLACGDDDARPATETSAERDATAYTVNYPLQYFAQRIAGNLVQVEFPAPVDEDPAFWTPDADAISGGNRTGANSDNAATSVSGISPESTPDPSRMGAATWAIRSANSSGAMSRTVLAIPRFVAHHRITASPTRA